MRAGTAPTSNQMFEMQDPNLTANSQHSESPAFVHLRHKMCPHPSVSAQRANCF